MHDKLFFIAKNSKYDGSQKGLASVVYKYFDETFAKHSTGTNSNSENQKQEEQTLKSIIWKF